MVNRIPDPPELLSVKSIWSHAEHNAFTDLIDYRLELLCAFRESDSHENPTHGAIRLIVSSDGNSWSSRAFFALPGKDLRDPKLSIMPDGRLMLLVGITSMDANGQYLAHDSFVSFSENTVTWTPLKQVLEAGDWLWRLTWHQGVGYGVAYRYTNLQDHRLPWTISLFQTADGIHFDAITQLDVPGYPSEATVRFTEDDEMILLVRRETLLEGGAWLGRSRSPFTHWSWQALGYHLEGPNFLLASDRSLLAAGRIWHEAGEEQAVPCPKTALCRIDQGVCTPLILLPSAGDNSYPGMVTRDNILWMSYYSTHEGKTSIYLAKIQL